MNRIATTMVLLAADRTARTPVNLNPGWGSLRQELVLASSIRTALRYGGFQDRRQGVVPRRLAILQRSLAQHHAPFPYRAPRAPQNRMRE